MNRPDRPGWYWYHHESDDLEAVRLVRHVDGQPLLRETRDEWQSINEWCDQNPGEWLGEAIPPSAKKWRAVTPPDAPR